MLSFFFFFLKRYVGYLKRFVFFLYLQVYFKNNSVFLHGIHKKVK